MARETTIETNEPDLYLMEIFFVTPSVQYEIKHSEQEAIESRERLLKMQRIERVRISRICTLQYLSDERKANAPSDATKVEVAQAG